MAPGEHFDYAHEKFMLAVTDMAASSASLRVRVSHAWENHLSRSGCNNVPQDISLIITEISDFYSTDRRPDNAYLCGIHEWNAGTMSGRKAKHFATMIASAAFKLSDPVRCKDY